MLSLKVIDVADEITLL